jgi:hypothetical protein
LRDVSSWHNAAEPITAGNLCSPGPKRSPASRTGDGDQHVAKHQSKSIGLCAVSWKHAALPTAKVGCH